MIRVYVYDQVQSPRPWKSLLGNFDDCKYDEDYAEFTVDNAIISQGIVVAHQSSLEEEGIYKGDLEKVCRKNVNLTIIVVTGGIQETVSELGNLYYRQTQVGKKENDLFGKCFQRFVQHIETTGDRLYKLLEPTISDSPNAVALVIMCEGYLVVTKQYKNLDTTFFSRHAKTVSQRDWWFKPFRNQLPINELENELCRDLPAEIKTFFEQIEKDSITTISVQNALDKLRSTLSDNE